MPQAVMDSCQESQAKNVHNMYLFLSLLLFTSSAVL